MCKDKRTEYPFFLGLYTGSLRRPPLILYGALRTANSLGLNGAAAQDRVQFENRITSLAGQYVFNCVWMHQPDPGDLLEIWKHLPPAARENTVDWGTGKAGEIVGGSVVSALLSRQLVKIFPKPIVVPLMFIMSCQGSIASLWKKDWPDDPPPPSGGGGPGIAT